MSDKSPLAPLLQRGGENGTLEKLQQACAETSITHVAARLGLPRCTVSLVANGKYPANPKNILAKFDAVYSLIDCPHLNAQLTREQCRAYAAKPRPSNPLGLQHWRVCKNCEFNGDKS
jgi:hypothetical protein